MALIGNPIDFDRIRQRYESIVYPESKKTFQDSQFNQIRDTYAGLLQPAISPRQSSVTPTQMGVLGGMGSQTISQDATQPGQQVQLRFNPATGQTETIIPEYMAPFRKDQQDFLPVSTPFPIEAADPNPVSNDTINVVDPTGQGIHTRGGGGEGFKAYQDRIGGMQRPNFGQIASDVQSFNPAVAGLLGTITGMPIGPIAGAANMINKAQLKGLGVEGDVAIGQLADVYNDALKSGLSPEDALTRATLTSGTTLNEKAFTQAGIEELSIDDMLAEVEKKMDGKGEGGYSPPSGTTGTGGGAGPMGGTGKPGAGTSTGGGSSGSSGGSSGGAGGTGGSGATGGGSGGGGGGGGSGGGAGGSGPAGCFVEGTAIQMADGSTKEITTIKVGEETKGGIVQAKMEFMPQNIYNYKDVLVSGSHWVVEDNQLIAVEDSKHAILTDRIEPVYTFKTSDNRIWINDIEFGDFETGTDEDWEPHFEMVRQKLNKELRDGK